MCGISGYLDLKHKVNIKTLEKMTNVIKHRGPDDEGYVLFAESKVCFCRGEETDEACEVELTLHNVRTDCFLGLGHRRLSIIDLSTAGHQPMASQDQRYCITYNGEIYNYIEVRDELKRYGCSFLTETDTEVVLCAYRYWGEECVLHFNGMWSFAIYDTVEHKLFCSRDRLGAKPFYYYRKEDHFVFASEIKQICQDELYDRHINEKQLINTLMLKIQDYSQNTLFKDVYSLPAGSNLVVKLDILSQTISKFEIKQYWDLKIDSIDSRSDEWERYFEESVKLRLRSDARVGVMLSGGVDSSLIMSEVYKNKGNGIDSFTTCFEDANEIDETYYSHMVSDACHTRNHDICVDSCDSISDYKRMIWHAEDYVGISTLGAFLTLDAIKNTGIKVLLNGQGGDESMLGYERYYAYYIKDLCKKKLIKGIVQSAKIVNNSGLTSKELFLYLLYFGIPRLRIVLNKHKNRHLFSKDFVKEFSSSEVLSYIKVRDLIDMIYKELRETQLTHILRMDDRFYMASSIESRVPFIDYRYLESAVRINPMLKIQNGYSKYLFRQKMEGRIPDEVVWRKNKLGWPSPRNRWIDRLDGKEIEELLNHPKTSKYFNMNYVKELWRKNPYSANFEIFLFTELFVREFDLVV